MNIALPTEILLRRNAMVYCSKCGTLNADDANVCVKCGSPLKAAAPEWGHYRRHRHYEDDYHYRGAGLGALVFGGIILLVGLSIFLSEAYGYTFPWNSFWHVFWPVVLVLIGVWVLYIGVRRSRGYRSPPPQ